VSWVLYIDIDIDIDTYVILCYVTIYLFLIPFLLNFFFWWRWVSS